MVKKAPRRTAERILEVALDLFNQFGEPNVSTTAIAAELRISPGNLYYHYPAKEGLINALLDRHARAIQELLSASAEVRNIEDAWFFMHTLFEQVWQHRFLYRDLNDLLSKNRYLETRFQSLLGHKTDAMQAMLHAMAHAGSLHVDASEHESIATNMVLIFTYWLSFEYVRDPRRALEPQAAQAALARGTHHALHLLMPYLAVEQGTHLRRIAEHHAPAPQAHAAKSIFAK